MQNNEIAQSVAIKHQIAFFYQPSGRYPVFLADLMYCALQIIGRWRQVEVFLVAYALSDYVTSLLMCILRRQHEQRLWLSFTVLYLEKQYVL